MAEPTKEELMARIAELEKQVAGKKSGKLEFKVSEKGGVSVYGLGRFPVPLSAPLRLWVSAALLKGIDKSRQAVAVTLPCGADRAKWILPDA